MSIKDVFRSWDNFFFKAESVDLISLFRILWCSLLLIMSVIEFTNISIFYGPHALVSLDTTLSQFAFSHLDIFQYLRPSYATLYAFFGIYLIFILSALFGFYTRFSLSIVFIALVSLHQRNIWLLSSADLLIRLVTLYLIFSPCGQAFSIDSLLTKKSDQFVFAAPWALRLLQIQLSVVYLWTVWHKLKGGDWVDGTAVYYATRLEAMKNFPIPYIFNSIPILKMMTWGTLLVEFLLGSFIWFKEFRRPLIIIGIGFHLCIEYSMSIPFFEIIMMAMLLLFTPGNDIARLAKFLRSFKPKSLVDLEMTILKKNK